MRRVRSTWIAVGAQPTRVTVLIPAHNEGRRQRSEHHGNGRGAEEPLAPIVETLESLRRQSRLPDRIVVIADNCTDDTATLARAHGADVFTTSDNSHKKAGALNQWLDANLPDLDYIDHVLVMDADSTLAPDFIANALRHRAQGYHAVGGVFLGKDGGGFVGMLQRNEYARYARDVERKQGQTLVLTGTATLFSAICLKDVIAARESGRIPGTGEISHVYDTKALTEDNELTFAIQHIGYKIIAPPSCALKTEVMESWGDLWRQRYRWKRGAIENNWHYGLTRYTAKHWFLQIWGLIGILATAIYLSTLVAAFVTGAVYLHWIWMAVTLIFVFERAITVSRRGWKQVLLAGVLIIEMPYDLYLQLIHLWALSASVLRTRATW
nr:glycosyltransferase family 2 protein [Microbacterium esteraromaticum]